MPGTPWLRGKKHLAHARCAPTLVDANVCFSLDNAIERLLFAT
jgi:hypothetical protein